MRQADADEGRKENPTVKGSPMKAYTDYPIVQLGDIAGQPAPIREIDVLGYDGNKYATIEVEGLVTEIKLGYCYTKPGRSGEVPVINPEDIREW